MNGTLLDRSEFPDGFGGVDELEAFMARPSRELVDDLAPVSGDILVLGAGGKMGLTLTKLARNAGAAMAVQPDPIRKWREQYARPCLRVDFEPPDSGTAFTPP